MNKMFLIVLLGLLTSTVMYSQKSDEKEIKDVITKFAKAGDENNVSVLNKCLDANYRIVMNQMFGSTDVSVVPKSMYLDKIKSKEWGGDKRKLIFESIMVNGNTASAKLQMKGEKMSMSSIISLIKNADGEWKLVADTPVII